MFPEYDGRLPEVIARAKEAGVTRFVVPGTDYATSQQAIELAQQCPEIIPAIGLHPLNEKCDLNLFRSLAALPEVKAIGEIGTDSGAGDWAEQERRFRFFLELAIEHNKPVLVHIRDTWQPTLAIMAEYPQLRDKAVIHCFTGDQIIAGQIHEHGYLLSFTAILARSKYKETQAVATAWPLDRMMLETDSPWLSWPSEKGPNEPSTVRKLAEFIASLHGCPVEEVAKATTQTAKVFFNL
mgnify:CR=1 FL=1